MRVEDVVDYQSAVAYLGGLNDHAKIRTAKYLAYYLAVSEFPFWVRDCVVVRYEDKLDFKPLVAWRLLMNAIVFFDDGKSHTEPFSTLEYIAFVESNVAQENLKFDPDVLAEWFTRFEFCSGKNVDPNGAHEFLANFPHYRIGDASGLDVANLRQIFMLADKSGLVANMHFTSDPATEYEWKLTEELLNSKSSVDWSFWIVWYERLLAGKDIYPALLKPLLSAMDEADWLNNPDVINAQFDGVLALYWAEDDAGLSGTSEPQTASTHHIKTILSQVSTLREFLDAEYLKLSGHNARSPEQDDVLDILRDLKSLVDDMLERFEKTAEDEQALAVVQENLPAVVEKASELAIVEPTPQVSETVMIMSATIRSLTDSGADQKLATQFAISEAAAKKLSPGLGRFFPWLRKSGDKQ